METTDYNKQANDFLRKTSATMEINFSHNGKHFVDDKQNRDIYKVTISKGTRSFTFKFGQSIAKSGLRLQMGKKRILIELPNAAKHLGQKKNETALRYWIKRHIDFDILPIDKITYPEQPTPYDVLACLQKYDVGNFEDFCCEFGYDTDSRRAEKTYQAVCQEYDKLCTIFTGDEMELMREIN